MPLVRLFIGITISNKTQQKINSWRQEYMELLPIRWVKPENLHVTLVPPFNENPQRIITKLESLVEMKLPDLTIGVSSPRASSEQNPPKRNILRFHLRSDDRDILQKRINPFTITFDNISTGPRAKRPRIIWAYGNPNEKILNLKKTLENHLQIKPKEKEFFMHITLAKISLPSKCPFEVKELQEKISWRESVETITLYESHLLPNGSQYEILHQASLH